MPLAYDEIREGRELARAIAREEIEAAKAAEVKIMEPAQEKVKAEVPKKGK